MITAEELNIISSQFLNILFKEKLMDPDIDFFEEMPFIMFQGGAINARISKMRIINSDFKNSHANEGGFIYL